MTAREQAEWRRVYESLQPAAVRWVRGVKWSEGATQ